MHRIIVGHMLLKLIFFRHRTIFPTVDHQADFLVLTGAAGISRILKILNRLHFFGLLFLVDYFLFTYDFLRLFEGLAKHFGGGRKCWQLMVLPHLTGVNLVLDAERNHLI